MTVHPRADWTKVPATDAHPLASDYVRGTAIHWNGPPVPVSALTDPRAYLEGVRRYHRSKSWSDIAYNLAVDQNGDVWVLRGLRHMSAANGDNEVNARYVAVLAIIGQGQKPTLKMLAGLRDVVTMVRAEYPRAMFVKTHNQVRPAATACPGPDLTRAVDAGDLEPRQLPPVSVSKMQAAWKRDRRRATGLHPTHTRRVQRALGFAARTGRWGWRTRSKFGPKGPTKETLQELGRGRFRVIP